MTLRLGYPRAALIVAPHPDDEVIGAAHLMTALLRRGCRVSVIVVSDGAASHPNSVSHPRARLVAERRRESRRALRRIGIMAGAIRFLSLPDGALSRPGSRCNLRLRRALARHASFNLIVGPATDDAHPDHRAVAAALAAAPGAARRLGYRVWPTYRSRSLASSVVGAGHAVKRSLIATYRTQTGAIRDDPAGFSIADHEARVFAHSIEQFIEMRR